jgi:hypothetical protein
MRFFLFHEAHRKYLPLDGARIRQMPADIQRPLSALETVLPPLDLFLRCYIKMLLLYFATIFESHVNNAQLLKTVRCPTELCYGKVRKVA